MRTIQELINEIQDNVVGIKEDYEQSTTVWQDCCELYLWIEDYIIERGLFTARLVNNDIVRILKLGILFDEFWIRYSDTQDDLIDKTLNLCDIKEIIE